MLSSILNGAGPMMGIFLLVLFFFRVGAKVHQGYVCTYVHTYCAVAACLHTCIFRHALRRHPLNPPYIPLHQECFDIGREMPQLLGLTAHLVPEMPVNLIICCARGSRKPTYLNDFIFPVLFFLYPLFHDQSSPCLSSSSQRHEYSLLAFRDL